MKERQIPFSPPDITDEEIKEVVDTLKSGWITTGPKTKLLEKQIAKFCETDCAVCLNSATACLEMALRLLEIGPGDEVITSAYTYTASASVVMHVGATLVLVDTEKNSYEMDYEQLEAAITLKTKAIIPVDIAGVLCNYDKLFEIVEKKKKYFSPNSILQRKIGRIAVVADSAHGFGAQKGMRRAGSIADFTSFSFHAVKNLTTAEGGALTWRNTLCVNNEEIYKQLMLLSLHGQSKDALAKNKLGSWEYDVIGPYYKCNMTDIMSSIGLVQLKRYPELLQRRRKIIEMYENALQAEPVDTLKHYKGDNMSSGHLYLMRVQGKNREQCNDIIKRMAEMGVAANVHYKPLPLLTAYKKMGFFIEEFPNAYNMYINEITLPLHTKLTDEDVEYVVDVFRKSLK